MTVILIILSGHEQGISKEQMEKDGPKNHRMEIARRKNK